MVKRRLFSAMMILLATIICMAGFSSCGTTRTYWGVEHCYDSDDCARPYYKGKKCKKDKKHFKHKKHHKHHHHDDD